MKKFVCETLLKDANGQTNTQMREFYQNVVVEFIVVVLHAVNFWFHSS